MNYMVNYFFVDECGNSHFLDSEDLNQWEKEMGEIAGDFTNALSFFDGAERMGL